MAFTPSEIKNKAFTRIKNGFEPTEVEQYLEQLSHEIERLKEDKKQLEKVLEERDAHIQSFKEVEKSVGEAIVSAQRAADETKAAAQKERDAIIQKAQAEASQIVNDGIEKARRLSFQTEDMKRQSKVFRSRFKMLVEAQLDLLKSDDWEYLLNYDLDSQQVTEENFQHLNEQDITAQEKQQAEQANQQPNETSSSETDK
ncbi:DivIVA domain-containing protein [Staphylococcus pseudintermedius]|uniref:DivIVA domain-containing protein n=1 Tax=Staphylococcus pseudintermedius TaxID=283734 RepID=UPI0001FFAE68|nr:DivIVA domain-containing protein [Staphylococcus pseudintermedius]ADX76866.1 putative cell-division initiation protein [Staphylococcus pseudintermedius ED99]EGQ0391536.1 DivIVA domain-containing protein [Staphylococcus pseudintermedius]EGQ1721111.1 DivIVA domain-containing protein [Staphylococcus pseudintermedius]EGQ1787335.1 DivIVA domain-containing protein [Staphylococcus pseudintermedius]EGQ2898991.1 DivIVA domain-containing protein [Staphylococcus pseudintermedius]